MEHAVEQKIYYHIIVDIDECSVNTDNCDINARCNNTDGSYICVCNDGYMGDGQSCVGNIL